MREDAPCASWQRNGTICDPCQEYGVGYCQSRILTHDAIHARLHAKIEIATRPGSRSGLNLTHEEARLVAHAWNARSQETTA